VHTSGTNRNEPPIYGSVEMSEYSARRGKISHYSFSKLEERSINNEEHLISFYTPIYNSLTQADVLLWSILSLEQPCIIISQKRVLYESKLVNTTCKYADV
jgi:hypothetical protein